MSIKDEIERMAAKVDATHDVVLDLRPKVESALSGFQRMEERLRGTENEVSRHHIKISAIETDTGNIWKQLRKHGAEGGGWVAVIDFLSVLPKFWHVATLVGMLLAGLGLGLWRHWK